MSKGPSFLLRPIIRCFHQSRLPSSAFCGRPAIVMRASSTGSMPSYFCRKHAKPTDEPLPRCAPYRRVRVQLQVDFAGVSWSPAAAEAEAIARAERAIAIAGGVQNLSHVHSTVIEETDSEPLGAQNASGTDHEGGE